jgi:hypothetical protein
MDVIGFLCVSYVAAQFIHDNLDSRLACTHQRLVSVVKMATVLEEYNTEERRSVARFFLGKRTKCKGYS